MMYLYPQSLKMGNLHPNFGVMVTPGPWGLSRGVKEGRWWGCDNGAFSGFDADKFYHFLNRLESYKDTCLFVVMPDVVGDAVATLAEPSTEPEPVASPVKERVLAVDQASAVVALPERDAVIVPALKSPLASLATTFDAVLRDVASTVIVPLVVIVPPVR